MIPRNPAQIYFGLTILQSAASGTRARLNIITKQKYARPLSLLHRYPTLSSAFSTNAVSHTKKYCRHAVCPLEVSSQRYTKDHHQQQQAAGLNFQKTVSRITDAAEPTECLPAGEAIYPPTHTKIPRGKRGSPTHIRPRLPQEQSSSS